jgi:hypothetical protein
MITYPIDAYFNRHDPSKRFEKHLFRAGYGAQSAEINEIQENLLERSKGIADAIFKDGDIVRDCQAVVDEATGAVQMEGGALYLRGAVRGVAPAAFTIPVNTVVQIGIRLTETVVTELQDPTLRDPATGTRNFDEPGAGRLQVIAAWGWNGDGGTGEFYGVYTVESGVLLPKEPPPAFDAIAVSIARYDRDSAGGSYIVNGMPVSASYDRQAQKVTVLVGEGRSRVNGFPVELARSLRTIYDADPDLKSIIGEPETYLPTSGSMRINLDNAPLISLQRVLVTAQKEATITHGAFSGAADPIPDDSILSIVAVNQGGTWNGASFVGGQGYTQGIDFQLTSGDIDWSLNGQEPAPGSSYKVVYRYQSATAGVVTGIDDTGFTLSGPIVSGTVVAVDYTFALPRIDAITLDADGRLNRIKGVASQYRPAQPTVPNEQLRIAGLRHDWFGDPVVERDAVVVLPMAELQGLRTMVFDLFDLVAQERLRNDVSLADPAAKRGVFVDPFTNDNLRDAGISGQSLAVFNGELRLAIAPAVNAVGAAITAPELLPYTLETVIEQPFRTGSMKINPYQAFDPIPGAMALTPPVDFWTEVNVTWASDITRRFTNGTGGRITTTTSTGVEVVGVSEESAQFIRQRSVGFTIQGFGPGEVLQTLTFDGIAVTPENP